MPYLKTGDKVKIQVTTKLIDGTLAEGSVEKEPFEFELGSPNILPELTRVVLEMGVEESKILQLPPEKAYGIYDESLVVVLPKESFPAEYDLKEGKSIFYESEDHELKCVKVKAMDEANVYVDYNHPLAGKELQFEIKLVEII